MALPMSMLDWAELSMISARLDTLVRRRLDTRTAVTPAELTQLRRDIETAAAERELILGRLFDTVQETVGAAA